ncbi:glycosyltransferase [uncultured Helicobacter sp.]|uniref:glycosyltransferase n=1 Tax=uncultured Helicobacter sp. TaxID=175537 RepID=UPI002603645B|nr:glycosyltransferase [uncultured Helicobacter sp.]
MNHTLNIIIPVLNEEKRLQKGIEETLRFLQTHKIPHILSIVDNGSSDSTPILAQSLCKRFNSPALDSQISSRLEYIRLEQKGVGLSLRAAIKHNATRSNPCAFIGYMDIDLSTDLQHLCEVYERLCNGANIVVGSRLLQDSQVSGRSKKREILSRMLNVLLQCVLKTTFSDVMCGFKFYQASIAQHLVAHCNEDTSWFYCAQILIIAEQQGIKIEEIPVKWDDEPTHSKVKILSLSRIYLYQIWQLWLKRYRDKRG